MPIATAGKLTKRGEIPARVYVFSQKLADQGYSLERIAAALAAYGYHIPLNKIREWTDEEYAFRVRVQRQRQRSRKRNDADTIVTSRFARMREMRHAKLSYRSIAAMMKVDYAIDMSEEQARHMLKGEVSHRTMKRVLADPQGMLSTVSADETEEPNGDS